MQSSYATRKATNQLEAIANIGSYYYAVYIFFHFDLLPYVVIVVHIVMQYVVFMRRKLMTQFTVFGVARFVCVVYDVVIKRKMTQGFGGRKKRVSSARLYK